MSEKKTYWMRTPDGAKALVTGAEDRDTWTVRGAVEDDEPKPGEFVWLQHEQHGGRAKFPAEVVEQWELKGWHPSPPLEPVDLTRDPHLVDVPVEKSLVKAEDKPAKADDAEKKTEKPAASRTETKE